MLQAPSEDVTIEQPGNNVVSEWVGQKVASVSSCDVRLCVSVDGC